MKTTRSRILEYLQDHPSASAGELGRALEVTPADVRHHLGVLLDEKVIAAVGQKPKSGRGRPVQLYMLSEKLERNNLDGLAEALLRVSFASLPPEERPGFLRRLAEALSQGEDGSARNPTQRFYHAIHLLNEMDYQAGWEARPGAPRVIFGRCPYAALLPEHPELCQLDALLIEKLTGTSALQLARQELTAQGLRQCVFQLKK